MARDTHRVRRPTRRLRPSERRQREQTRRAVLILTAAGLAVLGVAIALFLNRSPALDPATGCIAGQAVPPQHTVVLIDQTDPLTVRQISYVKAMILAEYDRLRPSGKLTIRSITADPQADAQEFARCRVRRGAEVNGLTANPDMIEDAFKRAVGGPLNDYLNGLARVPTSPRSPILESVDETMDAPDFGPGVRARRLVMVSDMAQNSDQLSQYGGAGSGLTLSASARDVLARDMHGVVVRIHYVRRPALETIQSPQQRQFWIDWFREQGAAVKLGWGLQLVDRRGERTP